MVKTSDVIKKINGAIAKQKGAALSHAELLDIAEVINTNAGAAKAHADMLHALIERSPAHASYQLH